MSALESVGTTLTIGSQTFCFTALAGLGIDGGDPIDDTCLSNTAYKTKIAQALKEVADLTFTADYEPADWAAIVAETNVNQSIVLNFPSPLGALTFWGWLRSFTPAESGVGGRWTGTGTVVISNLNASGVETGPVYA